MQRQVNMWKHYLRCKLMRCKSSCTGYLTWKCQQEVPASYSGHGNWTPSISWVLELPLDKPPLNDGVIGLVLAVQFNEPTGKWLALQDR